MPGVRFVPWPILFLATLLLQQVGCSSLATLSSRRADLCAAKLSFIRLNTTGNHPRVKSQVLHDALELLKASAHDLDQKIDCGVGPTADQMSGPWLGINKGMAAAAVGWMQDIKYFAHNGRCDGGFNIAVHQVAIGDLECRGWKPKTDCITGEPKSLGNFVVVPNDNPGPLRLDYRLGDNPWYDPSRVLLDDLVVIDDDLILGRASMCVGGKLRTLAYFVLLRLDSTVSCDE